LGIDPGLNHTGFGIIEEKNKQQVYLDSGVISTSVKTDFALRLKKIFFGVEDLIKLWQPDVISIEEVIYAQNVKTALKLGHARGVVLLAGAKANIDLYEYSPRKIKSSVTGNGAAGKDQVKFMVTRLLKLKQQSLNLDASDALAIALCFLFQNKLLR